MKHKNEITNRKQQHERQPNKVRIEFHDDKAQAVFIAGTFNVWRHEAMPMIQLGEGRWGKELALPPGRYEYRFVVDGEWVNDPSATELISNTRGAFNSVLVVGERR